QGVLEDGQFGVDLDAQTLEGAFGGVTTGAAGGGRDRLADQLGEYAGGDRGALGTTAFGAADDAGCETSLTVYTQDPGEVGGGVGVDHVGGGQCLGAVHTHVERGLVCVGETAVGLVQLWGGHPQVEQDGLRVGDPRFFQRVGDLGVDRVH